jgi:outer membrane immunogenic protein
VHRFVVALSMSAVVGLGVSSFAFAADMPVKAPEAGPVYSWSGLYIGGNVGYGLGKKTGDIGAFSTAPPAVDFTAAVAAGGTPGSLGTKSAGIIGGVQIGYIWQKGPTVWGVEIDIQGSGISGNGTVGFPGGGGIVPSTSTGQEKLRWFGTARLRGGYLVTERALLYITGGFAYGGVSNSATNIFSPATAGTFLGSTSQTKGGWTVGTGVDWAFTDRWSLRAEYLYVDLGSTTVRLFDAVNFPGAFVDYKFRHSDNIGRISVNFKL